MIWHDHILVEQDTGIMLRNRKGTLLNNFSYQ